MIGCTGVFELPGNTLFFEEFMNCRFNGFRNANGSLYPGDMFNNRNFIVGKILRGEYATFNIDECKSRLTGIEHFDMVW